MVLAIRPCRSGLSAVEQLATSIACPVDFSMARVFQHTLIKAVGHFTQGVEPLCYGMIGRRQRWIRLALGRSGLWVAMSLNGGRYVCSNKENIVKVHAACCTPSRIEDVAERAEGSDIVQYCPFKGEYELPRLIVICYIGADSDGMVHVLPSAIRSRHL